MPETASFTATPPISRPRSIGSILTEVRLKRKQLRRRRQPRSTTWSWKRLRLLAIVAERPGISTADAARLADLTRPRANEALLLFAGSGLILKGGHSRRCAWSITAEGLQEVLRQGQRRCSEMSMGYTRPGGKSHKQNGTTISLTLELAHSLVKRLRDHGWRRGIIKQALQTHRLGYIKWQIDEVEKARDVRSIGAVLYTRLLRMARNGGQQEDRRHGLATKVLGQLSPSVSAMYLHVSEEMSPKLYVHLAYSLRSIHRKGKSVTPGDVSGVAGHLLKREATRQFWSRTPA